MLDIRESLHNELNLDINLTHVTFESEKIKCHCDSDTVRIFKNRKNEKGVIGIYYHSKEGPLVCISYRRQCKSCGSQFHYGYEFNATGDQIFENTSIDKAYHLNCMTYFDVRLFKEYNMWSMDDGVGYESFTTKYNHRFSEEIQAIAKKLTVLNQTLGRRNNVQPLLSPQRFEEAFNVYFLQTQLETSVSRFRISKHIFKKVEMMQQMKLDLHILKKGKHICKNFEHVSHAQKLVYKFLFRKPENI